jgi:hypothetical protein
MALRGALGGALLALPVLAGLAWLGMPLAGPGARGALGFPPPPALWLPLLVLPPCTWLLARVVAALTVRRWLARMP